MLNESTSNRNPFHPTSVGRDIIDVFFNPGRLFERVRTRPQWIAPLIVFVVLMFIIRLLQLPYFESAYRFEILTFNWYSSDAAKAASMAYSHLLEPFGYLCVLLLWTFVIHGICVLLRARARFLDLFSGVVYSNLIMMPSLIVGAIILWLRGGPETVRGVGELAWAVWPHSLIPMASHWIFGKPLFMDQAAHSPTPLNAINFYLFVLWNLAVTTIAVKRICRLNRARAIVAISAALVIAAGSDLVGISLLIVALVVGVGARFKSQEGDVAVEDQSADSRTSVRLRRRLSDHKFVLLLCGVGACLIGIVCWTIAHQYFSGRSRPVPEQPASGRPNASAGNSPRAASTSRTLPASGEKAQPGRTNPKDGLNYVWIPPGTFIMGCSPGDNECFPDEKPPQRVSIDRGFWISQTEVTQAAYRRVTGQDPSFFKGGSLPVESITWDQARSYCRSVDMRLPTEEEWEYAARAGSTLSRYQDLDPFNAYDFLHSHEVAKPRPNAWGLYDTLGNVAEWTENGSGASGSKVVRGGSFGNTPEYVRVSARMSYPPAYSSNSLGVRCAGE